MLIVSKSRRIALFVPLLLLVTGGAGLTAGVISLVRGASASSIVLCGLFGAGILWLALAELVLVRADGHQLSVRSVFRQSELRVAQAELGVSLKAGSRAARYVVFATDGEASADLGEWMTERGARRRAVGFGAVRWTAGGGQRWRAGGGGAR